MQSRILITQLIVLSSLVGNFSVLVQSRWKKLFKKPAVHYLLSSQWQANTVGHYLMKKVENLRLKSQTKVQTRGW